jgi:hypothetical protein
MQAVENVERRGLSSGWRAIFLFAFALLQVLVIWKLVEELSAARWTFACFAVPLTGVLLTGLYGLATKVNPTRKILWWIFLFSVTVLAVDIFKLLHHSLTGDPFWAIFSDALGIGICISWIWRRPFAMKHPSQ